MAGLSLFSVAHTSTHLTTWMLLVPCLVIAHVTNNESCRFAYGLSLAFLSADVVMMTVDEQFKLDICFQAFAIALIAICPLLDRLCRPRLGPPSRRQHLAKWIYRTWPASVLVLAWAQGVSAIPTWDGTCTGLHARNHCIGHFTAGSVFVVVGVVIFFGLLAGIPQIIENRIRFECYILMAGGLGGSIAFAAPHLILSSHAGVTIPDIMHVLIVMAVAMCGSLGYVQWTVTVMPAIALLAVGAIMAQHHQHTETLKALHMQVAYGLWASGLFRLFELCIPFASVPLMPAAPLGLVFTGMSLMLATPERVDQMERFGLMPSHMFIIVFAASATLVTYISIFENLYTQGMAALAAKLPFDDPAYLLPPVAPESPRTRSPAPSYSPLPTSRSTGTYDDVKLEAVDAEDLV